MSVRIKEKLKTALLIVLFVSMTVLAGTYIVQTRRLTIDNTVDVTADNLLILRGGDISAAGELVRSRVLPQYIAYKLTGEEISASERTKAARAVIGSHDIILNIYTSLSEYIYPFMSGDAICELSDKDWLSLYNAENYIALHFEDELPAPVLAMYMSSDSAAESSDFASGDVLPIKDIMLLPTYEGGGWTLEMYTRSIDGIVAGYKADAKQAAFPLTILTEYNQSAEFTDFAPAGASNSDISGLSADITSLVTQGDVSSKLIMTSGRLQNFLSADPNSFLKLFNFNPDRVNRYNETDGDIEVTVYIESFGNLTISSDGNMRFAISEGKDNGKQGINVSEYLGYSNYSGNYSIGELLKSTEAFISRLYAISASLTGGDADIVLSAVYTDSGNVVIEYSYNFDNIRIYAKGGAEMNAFRFVIRSGSITEITVNTLMVTNRISRRMCVDQHFMLSRITEEFFVGNNVVDAAVPNENALIDIPAEEAEDIPAQLEGEIALGYILPQDGGEFGADWILKKAVND